MRKQVPDPAAFGLLGTSAALQTVVTAIGQAASSEAGVLIVAETGSGKELAARAVHALSSRKSGPFVVVDCSNLSPTLAESLLYGHTRGAFTDARAEQEGLVAEADGGTLFLDEIGELPLALQKSFLRVLQERTYRQVGSTRERVSDFRLIAATNRDIEAMAASGAFREDLLFRLRTLEIRIPPLRERPGDIAVLAGAFTEEFARKYGTPHKQLFRQTLLMLESYPWPGNVRELRNTMEAAVIASGAYAGITPAHLPRALLQALLGAADNMPATSSPDSGWATPPSYSAYREEQDKVYFSRLMSHCGNNVAEASRLSGLSQASIYRYIRLYGLR
jgi:two-component system NtrC family response regulator